jgi:hypothetical protein
MTASNIAPSQPRPSLRVQLTVLYAGLFALLVTAILAVSGVLQRQGSTNVNGRSSSHNIIFGQHFNVGPFIVTVIAAILAVGLAWRIAGWVLRRSTPSTSE